MLNTSMIGPRACRLISIVLNRELHTTGSCLEFGKIHVPVFEPDLKKPGTHFDIVTENLLTTYHPHETTEPAFPCWPVLIVI